MRNKKAKMLRNKAREMSNGQPNVEYYPYEPPRMIKDTMGWQRSNGTQFKMKETCTRYILKLLKRGLLPCN